PQPARSPIIATALRPLPVTALVLLLVPILGTSSTAGHHVSEPDQLVLVLLVPLLHGLALLQRVAHVDPSLLLRDDPLPIAVQLHGSVSLRGVGRSRRVAPHNLQAVHFDRNLPAHNPHGESHDVLPRAPEHSGLSLALLDEAGLGGLNSLRRRRVLR